MKVTPDHILFSPEEMDRRDAFMKRQDVERIEKEEDLRMHPRKALLPIMTEELPPTQVFGGWGRKPTFKNIRELTEQEVEALKEKAK